MVPACSSVNIFVPVQEIATILQPDRESLEIREHHFVSWNFRQTAIQAKAGITVNIFDIKSAAGQKR